MYYFKDSRASRMLKKAGEAAAQAGQAAPDIMPYDMYNQLRGNFELNPPDPRTKEQFRQETDKRLQRMLQEPYWSMMPEKWYQTLDPADRFTSSVQGSAQQEAQKPVMTTLADKILPRQHKTIPPPSDRRKPDHDSVMMRVAETVRGNPPPPEKMDSTVKPQPPAIEGAENSYFYKKYGELPVVRGDTRANLEAKVKAAKERKAELDLYSLSRGSVKADQSELDAASQDLARWENALYNWDVQTAQSRELGTVADKQLAEALLDGRNAMAIVPGYSDMMQNVKKPLAVMNTGINNYRAALEKIPWYNRTAISMWGSNGDNDPSVMRVNAEKQKAVEGRLQELGHKAGFPVRWTGDLDEYRSADFRRLSPAEQQEFLRLYTTAVHMREQGLYSNYVDDVMSAKRRSILSGLTGVHTGEHGKQNDQLKFVAHPTGNSDLDASLADDWHRNKSLDYVGHLGGTAAALAAKMSLGQAAPSASGAFSGVPVAGNAWSAYMSPGLNGAKMFTDAFGAVNELVNPQDGSARSDLANSFQSTTDTPVATEALAYAAAKPVLTRAGQAIPFVGPWALKHPQAAAYTAGGAGAVAGGGIGLIKDRLARGEVPDVLVKRLSADGREAVHALKTRGSGQIQQRSEDARYIAAAEEYKKSHPEATAEELGAVYEKARAEATDAWYDRHIGAIERNPAYDTPEKRRDAKIAEMDAMLSGDRPLAISLSRKIWLDRDIPIEKRAQWGRTYLTNLCMSQATDDEVALLKADAGMGLLSMFGVKTPNNTKRLTPENRQRIYRGIFERAMADPRAREAVGGMLQACTAEAKQPESRIGKAVSSLATVGDKFGIGFPDIVNCMGAEDIYRNMWPEIEQATPDEVNRIMSSFASQGSGQDGQGKLAGALDKTPTLKGALGLMLEDKTAMGGFTGEYMKAYSALAQGNAFSQMPDWMQGSILKGAARMSPDEFAEGYLAGRIGPEVVKLMGSAKGNKLLSLLPEAQAKALVSACEKRGKTAIWDWWKSNPGKTHELLAAFFGMKGWTGLQAFAENPVLFYGTVLAVLGIGAAGIAGLAGSDDEDGNDSGKRKRYNDYDGAMYDSRIAGR